MKIGLNISNLTVDNEKICTVSLFSKSVPGVCPINEDDYAKLKIILFSDIYT